MLKRYVNELTLILAGLLLVSLSATSFLSRQKAVQIEKKTLPLNSYKTTVERVIDGDTVVVDIQLGFKLLMDNETLRLADINTPELRGDERLDGLVSKKFVQDWVEENGGVVYIQVTKQGKFGRWLAHLWATPEEVGNTELSLNQILLDKGLAKKY